MNKLTNKEARLVELLSPIGVKKNGPQLAYEMGNDNIKEVHRVVKGLRSKFNKGNSNAVYVHLTRDGYSLAETPEHLHYEGNRRLKMGAAVICNGAHIYRRYKAVALNGFNAMRISFVPSAQKLISTVQEIKEG